MIMKIHSRAAMCVAVTFLAIGCAQAQCPANPLSVLAGTTWAFVSYDTLFPGDATIGIITASIGTATRGAGTGTSIGVLSITETFNLAGFVQSQATSPGSYTMNPDCSGGLLTLSSALNSYQYQFTFTNGQTKMYFVSANGSMPNIGQGTTIAGSRGWAALLPGVPSCAGVTQPLNLLTGNWGFQAKDFASASIGLLTASVGTSTRGTAGVPIGVLNAVVTSSGQNVQPLSQGPVTGSYVMNPDCSGGTVSFPSGEANQYAFVFSAYNAAGTPTEIYMVSTSTLGTSAGGFGGSGFFRGNFGIADRQ
jgi:hypothetical protein